MDKLQIKDMATKNVGEAMSGIMLIVSASLKQTKTKKSYLAVTLSDGELKTNSNVWDWKHANIPQPSDVVLIDSVIDVYNDNKQLSIKSLTRSTASSDLFVPRGDFNIEEYCNRFRTFINAISDNFVKRLVTNCFEENLELWKTVPAGLSMHHSYIGGTLQHSVDVCNNALALYANYSNITNPDIVIAGALLHDFGKLFTYNLNGAAIGMTTEGQLFDHLYIGAAKLDGEVLMLSKDIEVTDNDIEKLRMIQHVILSHHGRIEYGSPVTCKSPEAIIVSYADGADSKMNAYLAALTGLPEGSMWTNNIFSLSNRPHLTPKYVNEVMSDV